MPRLPSLLALASALGASPAFAHFASAPAPHWHASDTWGLMAVAALVAAAGWLDRRSR